ncbi:hypothetical protein IAT38_008165 [Cryptococcus sp. DSM 104549]
MSRIAMLFSRKVVAAGVFALTVLAIFSHVSYGTGTHVANHIGRLGLLPSTWSTAKQDLYVPQAEFLETKWINGVAGFNYFHNLYLTNGTFIVITSDPSHLPKEGMDAIFSGLADPADKWHHHNAAEEDRFVVVTLQEAIDKELVRPSAIRKKGISMFFNDVKEDGRSSFLDHYFHFIGEMFLGAWRLVSSAGETDLPARIMYRAGPADWRDRARITPWFQQSVMPDTLIEETSIFEDRQKTEMTFVFDKITIADRWAAHRVGQDVKYWNKANADLPLLPVPKTWMDPMRNRIKALAMAEGCDPQRETPGVPVVVYINRQLTGRRLVDKDAEELLDEMIKLDKEGVIEFHDARMEKLHRVQQFCLALRADIMFGVHGNGLSHQLWMKPGSGVLEIMALDGFARDYAILAEMMGHEYYAIHYNETFPPDKWRKPDGWAIGQGPDFHSAKITVDAKWFSDVIREMALRRTDVIEPALPY